MTEILDYILVKDFIRDIVDCIFSLRPYEQKIMPNSNPEIGVMVVDLAAKGDLRETGDGIVQRWWPAQEIYSRKELEKDGSNKVIFCFKNDRTTRYITFTEGWICEESFTDQMLNELFRQCGFPVGGGREENTKYTNKSRFIWIYRPDCGLVTRTDRHPGNVIEECISKVKQAPITEVRATLSPDPLDSLGALVDCGDSSEFTNN